MFETILGSIALSFSAIVFMATILPPKNTTKENRELLIISSLFLIVAVIAFHG